MDFSDLPSIIRNIDNEMSLHSENYAKVPYSFSQKMPKSLMDLSHKNQNKFLNNHLAEIEEAHHCKILSPKILNWFLRQNRKYHFESGILNHDGFFKKHPATYHKPGMDISDVAFLASLNVSANGVDLEGGNSDNHGTVFGNSIEITRVSTAGVIGAKYDRLAVNIFNAVGNERLACYDEDTALPDNLLAEVGSTASANGFNWRTVTEYELTTTGVWVGGQYSSGSNDTFYGLIRAAENKYHNQAFGAFPDPFGSIDGNNVERNYKCGHS